jgi:hypothetical protein
MEKSLSDRIAETMEFAKTMMVEQGGLNPMFILESERGAAPMIMPGADMGMASAVVRAIVQAYEIKRVLIVTEAWAVEAKGSDAKLDLNVPPSQHPDRIEIVSCMGFQSDGEWAQVTSRILRHRNGSVKGFEESKTMSSADRIGGRMSQIMPAPEEFSTLAAQEAETRLQGIGLETEGLEKAFGKRTTFAAGPGPTIN